MTIPIHKFVMILAASAFGFEISAASTVAAAAEVGLQTGHIGLAFLPGRCATLFADPEFDCACVGQFLEARLSNPDGDLVLSSWSYSTDRSRNRSGDVDSLYLKYGTLHIDKVLRRFNRMRIDLFMQCPGAEPKEDDDPRSGCALSCSISSRQ